jgi:1-acyl-sn-glycerol-3-phosphate acyltransferase
LNQRPPNWPLGNRLLYGLGRFLFWVGGWRVEGQLPSFDKFVLILAPHTSYWDLPIALAAEFSATFGMYHVRQMWMGKHTAFLGPLGALLRATGGVPVDRRSSHGTVETAIEAFNSHERLMIGVTPEGTRQRAPYWKSGFYHIALGAQVPIVCATIDYRRKVGGVGRCLWPSGDIEADLQIIRAVYCNVTALYPDRVGEIAIRPSVTGQHKERPACTACTHGSEKPAGSA